MALGLICYSDNVKVDWMWQDLCAETCEGFLNCNCTNWCLSVMWSTSNSEKPFFTHLLALPVTYSCELSKKKKKGRVLYFMWWNECTIIAYYKHSIYGCVRGGVTGILFLVTTGGKHMAAFDVQRFSCCILKELLKEESKYKPQT